jgi:serine/threonine protein phosphatase PrpC
MGMQGWRKSMEDAHIAQLDMPGGVSVFGVFDGHGGKFY